MVTPEWLFDERKTFSVRFSYSPVNEKFSKVFTGKVENFTNDKGKIIIIWNTQEIQSLACLASMFLFFVNLSLKCSYSCSYSFMFYKKLKFVYLAITLHLAC